MPNATARPGSISVASGIALAAWMTVRSQNDPNGDTGPSKYTRSPSGVRPMPSRPATLGSGGEPP